MWWLQNDALAQHGALDVITFCKLLHFWHISLLFFEIDSFFNTWGFLLVLCRWIWLQLCSHLMSDFCNLAQWCHLQYPADIILFVTAFLCTSWEFVSYWKPSFLQYFTGHNVCSNLHPWTSHRFMQSLPFFIILTKSKLHWTDLLMYVMSQIPVSLFIIWHNVSESPK